MYSGYLRLEKHGKEPRYLQTEKGEKKFSFMNAN